MMIKIACHDCGVEGSISLLEANYQGPYKCWKCRALFNINLVNNEVKSCQSLSQEEFDQLIAVHNLRKKYKKD